MGRKAIQPTLFTHSEARRPFKHTDGGLALRGGNATTFEIAGANGAWVSASAKVDADTTLLVSAASLAAPRHVRYAWAGLPALSLYNKAAPEIPGAPFRTDAPAFQEAPTGVRAPGRLAGSPARALPERTGVDAQGRQGRLGRTPSWQARP